MEKSREWLYLLCWNLTITYCIHLNLYTTLRSLSHYTLQIARQKYVLRICTVDPEEFSE